MFLTEFGILIFGKEGDGETESEREIKRNSRHLIKSDFLFSIVSLSLNSDDSEDGVVALLCGVGGV